MNLHELFPAELDPASCHALHVAHGGDEGRQFGLRNLKHDG